MENHGQVNQQGLKEERGMKTKRCYLIRSMTGIIAVLTPFFLQGAFAQDCVDVSGTWQVEENVTATFSAEGETETIETSGSGEITIEQNGCHISFYSPGLDGDIVLLREGTVTNNSITFSGRMVPDMPEVSCSGNLITGNGVIEGNTITVITTGSASCSAEGISVLITANGTAVFTRQEPPPFWKVHTIDIEYGEDDHPESVRIRDIHNPVWEGEFNPNTGDLISDVNKPIADDMNSRTYKINVKLKSYPEGEPIFTPTVRYEYRQLLFPIPEGSLPVTGTLGPDGIIEIHTPQNINKYTLELVFNIYDGETFVSTQPVILLDLYVTLDQPKPKGVIPKVEWLEKAVIFGSGANSESTVKPRLVKGIHDGAEEQGWRYNGGIETSWEELVENANINEGNCASYAKMWLAFAKILGVDGTTLGIIDTDGLNHFGFVTIKNLEALGPGNQCGNAHPPDSNNNDRWWFGIHVVGIEAGLFMKHYYDPTFGRDWVEWHLNPLDVTPRDFIEWHGTCEQDLIVCDSKKCQERAGWCLDEEENLDRQSLTPEDHYIYRLGNGRYEYHSPGLSDIGPARGNAAFAGVHVVTPLDGDRDGRFDQLLVTVEIEAIEPSDYLVFGCLSANGTYITQYATNNSTYPVSFAVTNQSGIVDVELGFSGEHIGNSGIDGPYTVTLGLFDANGFYLDETSFETTYYAASQFGELSAELMDANEIAIDTNGNSLFDSLLVTAEINVFREGDYYLDATLITADGKGIVSSNANKALSVGLESIDVAFDGKQINKVADSNSYTLNLVLFDAGYRQQGSFSFVTNVYNPADFERKDVLITGPYSDSVVDTDENALYDVLRFEAVLDVHEAGLYNITAWLQDSDGYDIMYADDDFDLQKGQQTVVFDFAGYQIRAHQADGPYSVIYLLVENSEGIVDSKREVYFTDRYNFVDFDPATGEVQEDFETGDFDKFEWIPSGDSDWIVTTDEHKSGTYSAKAGPIGNNGRTTLKLTLDCVSGDISFYYKVSSEEDYDYLRFYIDGSLQDEWSGNEDWTKVSFQVKAGRRTFEWTYSKDGSSSSGSDTAWIDDIVFPAR
ncbi:MAG: hypothetical protein JXA81_01070 [Sedimentisphaerales bacterium]|nr:hypothetical protein [Sedimentisphaerales bacterium]